MQDQPDYLKVKENQFSFSDAISKNYIDSLRKEELNKSDILLLPLENFRENIPLCFHSGTRSLYLFLKENHPEFKADLCIGKKEFKEIALHNDEFRLGTFLLECILAPTFVSVLSYYVKKNLSHKSDDKVTVNFIIVNDKSSKESLEISFRGSPVEMEKKINDKIKEYSHKGEIISKNENGKNIDELC